MKTSRILTLLFATLFPSLAPCEALFVHNPSTPVHPPVTVQARELWRIDGESQETVLGRIARVITGRDGRTYLLDYQSKNVAVIDQTGGIVARIGRVGEGPGECRNFTDLFLTDGGLALLRECAYADGRLLVRTAKRDRSDPNETLDLGGGSGRPGLCERGLRPLRLDLLQSAVVGRDAEGGYRVFDG